MADLTFVYGTMGSAKTAQALITKYNHEEHGRSVWLIKPAADTRDGDGMLKSRLGIEAEVVMIADDQDIFKLFEELTRRPDIVIADEGNLFTAKHIDQMRQIVDEANTNVVVYGLRTDFQTKLFPSSRRLMELADNIKKIHNLCDCGNEGEVNARFDADGKIVTTGEQVLIGGNESYHSVCFRCYNDLLRRQLDGIDDQYYRT